ncbi:hypothetical protein ACP70R_030455 [Stipagrostis hirtigluma subsp. patula]
MVLGSTWAEEEAECDAESRLLQATFKSGGLVGGLALASMAITLAVREPPAGLDKTTYFLMLLGAFLAGVIQVAASVGVADDDPRGHYAAGRKKLLHYASIASLIASVSLSMASLIW